MKWFQHQAHAHRDAKLKKLLIKYGAQGYGLYWFCIENICSDLEPALTFELEHDCEILAHELSIDTLKVQEMMLYMVNLGLFETSDGAIFCRKLALYLGDNLTRNDRLKAIIKQAKSDTVSDSLRLSQQEEKRGEEKRGEEIKNTSVAIAPFGVVVADDFLTFWQAYPKKTGKDAALKAWKKLAPNHQLLQIIINDISQRIELGAWCIGAGKAYIPGPAPYLNGKRWMDEIVPRPEFKPHVDFSKIAREAEIL